MEWEILSKTTLAKLKGKEDYKVKYHIKDKYGKEYCALKWSSVPVIVYDRRFDEELSKYNWTYYKHTGYVYAQKEAKYMHRIVCELAKLDGIDDKAMSVDHIMYKHKTDNRLCNLRVVSQAVQNSNRGTRADKKPPPQELLEIGVTELPRFVRWDRTEHKFVIEKHPHLLREVVLGIRKKPIMSCSKANISIKEKYDDAMRRLHELEGKYYTNEHIAFREKQSGLEAEYICIEKLIESYQQL